MRSSTRCKALAGSLALSLFLGHLKAQPPPAGSGEAIPAIAFFQPPDFYSPALSPNGRFIAFIGRANGHACLFLLERTTGKIQGLFSPGEGQVEYFWWKGDHRVLVAGRGTKGLTYFVQELDSTQPQEIPALKWVPVDWINPLLRDADHVVVAPTYNGRRVTEVDLRTGRDSKFELLEGNDNACVTSVDGELRAFVHRFGESWRIAWRTNARAAWHDCKGNGGIIPFRPVAIDADDHHLLVFAYDQGDTVALMRLDPETDQRTLLVQYPDRDVWEVVRDPGHQVPPVVTSYHYGGDDMQVLDDAARPFYASLARSLPGNCNRWESSSADGSLRVIHSWNAHAAGRYYLFDGNRKILSLLGQIHLDLPPAALAEVRCFTYQTRDDVSEYGYVVLPTKAQAAPPLLVLTTDHVGEPAEPGRDFNQLAQFFASRGIAVARFAVRGTHGFGRKFEKAGDFQFAGCLVWDAEDGVRHLAQAGLVDGKRVSVIGWSVGGLIALRMASSSPLFRAVAIVNSWADFPAEDVSWLTSSEASRDTLLEQLGGVKAVYKITHQLDPATFLGSLTAPVFVAYSSWYDRTPEEAGRLCGSFRRFKKPYEWFELDVHSKKRTEAEYEAELYTKIAEFLKRTL